MMRSGTAFISLAAMPPQQATPGIGPSCQPLIASIPGAPPLPSRAIAPTPDTFVVVDAAHANLIGDPSPVVPRLLFSPLRSGGRGGPQSAGGPPPAAPAAPNRSIRLTSGQMMQIALTSYRQLEFWDRSFRSLPEPLKAAIASSLAWQVSQERSRWVEAVIPDHVIAEVFRSYEASGAKASPEMFIDLALSKASDRLEGYLDRAAGAVLEQLDMRSSPAFRRKRRTTKREIALHLIIEGLRRDVARGAQGRLGILSPASVDAILAEFGVASQQNRPINVYKAFADAEGMAGDAPQRLTAIAAQRIAFVAHNLEGIDAFAQMPAGDRIALATAFVIESLKPAFGRNYVIDGYLCTEGVARIFGQRGMDPEDAQSMRLYYTRADEATMLENELKSIEAELEGAAFPLKPAVDAATAFLVRARAERSYTELEQDVQLFMWEIANAVVPVSRDFPHINEYRISLSLLSQKMRVSPDELRAQLHEHPERFERIAARWAEVPEEGFNDEGDHPPERELESISSGGTDHLTIPLSPSRSVSLTTLSQKTGATVASLIEWRAKNPSLFEDVVNQWTRNEICLEDFIAQELLGQREQMRAPAAPELPLPAPVAGNPQRDKTS
jgi:hypothetical protein